MPLAAGGEITIIDVSLEHDVPLPGATDGASTTMRDCTYLGSRLIAAASATVVQP